MSALDPFALGGYVAQRDDEPIVLLFRRWIEAARDWENAPDDTPERDDADKRWSEIEDEIDACPCVGAAGLAVKEFIYLRVDVFDYYAPLPYIRDDPESPAHPSVIVRLRDMARFVPEIAELAAAILHEDAELIDLEMDVTWCGLILAEGDGRSYLGGRPECERRLANALARIACIEAKTERGEAIKARHL